MPVLRRVAKVTAEGLIKSGIRRSRVPVPAGRFCTSVQSATYMDLDNTGLHVWFGAHPGTFMDDVYYTKTTDLVNWSTPVLVLHNVLLGLRDLASLIERGIIYLTVQTYDGGGGVFNEVHLYKVSIGADYSNPLSYTYVGILASRGGVGTFDSGLLASPVIRKLGGQYYLVYEAQQTFTGPYSIGVAVSPNIETLPYAKLGPLTDAATGQPLRNPVSAPNQAITPETFATDNILYIHYYNTALGGHWRVRTIRGDFPQLKGTISNSDIDPSDGMIDHCNIAYIGVHQGQHLFMIQSWNGGALTAELWLYSHPAHRKYRFSEGVTSAKTTKTLV